VNKTIQTNPISYPFERGLAEIGKSRAAGYRAVRDGELKTYLDGRRRMVTRKALEEYVARQEAKAA